MLLLLGVGSSLPGAHHWLHAEKPREFEAAVDTFLDRTGG